MAQETRYELMDGLRGLAAIGVLFFHLSIVGATQLVPRGYLAVDFFFILSGFVLSLSYERKLTAIRLRAFARIRAIRMFPLSIFGLLLGTVYFLFRFLLLPDSQYSLPDIAAGTAFNILLLPKPWISAAPTDTIFPANTPLWSLSLELAVNLLWVLVLPRLRTVVLVVVLIPTAAILAIVIVNSGHADLGAIWPTYCGGLLRAVFGFFMGVLLWRLHTTSARSIVSPLAPWLACGALAFILAVPGQMPIFDIVAITLAFPMILYASISMQHRIDGRLLRFLGDISYPLYATHVPVLMWVVGIAKALKLENMASLLAFAAVPLCIVFAALLTKFYDEPIRRTLSGRSTAGAKSPA